MSELSEIMKKLNAMDKRLDAIDKRLDALEQRMDALEQRMDKLEGKVEELSEKLKETEFVLRQESQYIYKVVCDNHKEVMLKMADIVAVNQQDQVILQSHTKKFNNMKQALS